MMSGVRRRRRSGGGVADAGMEWRVQSEKQEPHVVMWGKENEQVLSINNKEVKKRASHRTDNEQ